MNEYHNNGRALQLEGLENARNKVTLGFKCDGGTKVQLANEANQIGMTLSEYVETVLSLRHRKVDTPIPQKSNYTLNEWESKLNNAKKQTEVLQQRLSFYEGDRILNYFFEFYEGQVLKYPNLQNQEQSILITKISDMFTVLIHSFKPQQQ